MKFRTAKPIGFEDTDSAGSFLGDGEQTSSSSSFAPLCVVFEGPDNFSHAPNYVSTGGINAEGGDSFPQVFATSGDLSAAAGSKPVATIPQLANYLINGFWQYQGTISHHWALGTTITYNVNGLTTAEKFLAQSALVAWSDIANVTFVQTSGSAKITFNHNGTMTAFESDNYSNGGITSSATIDISADWITTDGGANDGKTGIDSYGYQTYIHEIGHALGLGHQGPYNGSASYSSGALYANDTWQYSVMSYFSESNYSGSSYRYVITPQMADIYAVQSIYGAGSGRAGNTTYGFHNTAGSIYDFTAYSQAPAFTIYDSSGTDTLDCSGYSVAQTIDLHAGSFSSIGGLINNIGIALSCTIEIAIGGSASDVIFANDSGSTLYGGSGDDDLTGGAGNDTLVGGTGNDTVDGGGGTDSVIFGGSRAGYIITGLSGGAVRVTGPDGTDTLVSVELLVFSDQTVNLGVSIDLTPPSIVSISTSGSAITGGSGILNTGKVVTLTVSMSEAVTVAGGTPTLSLNNGGTATYVSGSGTGALIFSYTVMAGQSINDLSVTTFNSNGATLKDTANNAADLSAATNYNPAGVLQIDTLAPTVASISTSGIGITAGSGNLNVGKVITLTVAMSETVMVAGTPTLSLNDGGNAAYVSGSGTGTLIFNHTVLPGQSTADLTVTSLNLGGATLRDAAGNAADLSGAANYNPAGVLKIDGLVPKISSITTFGASITNGNGSLNAGKVVTVTVNLSEAATLVGGTPTLSLNDGGNAAYVSGSGTDTLTFSHIVMSGQSTADLAVTAFNLNGASLRDSSNNDADLSGATNYNPAGLLVVDTSAPTLASVTTSGSGIVGGNGIVNTSSVVTLTVAMSEIVTVSGGTPTLSLNNGGVATYVSGSGTGPLIFGYTVAPGQSANDLIVTTFNLNGATINDAAGNAANLSAAAGYNPAGVLVIDTLVPTVVSISTSGNGITNGNGNINAGKVVTLAVAMSEAVTVTGGTPTLSLDDGGLASYVSGSGTDTLIFHHTATAGQSTTDLTVTAFNLNGAAVKDGAGNGANLSGAANYNPMGVLQIDTAGPAVLSLFATTDTQASTIASGHSVTVSIVSNETVTVTGSPILQLNDNEVATFTGGSGTNILTFSYVVVPTDNTPDLRVTGLSFPSGATISDSSGNSFGAVAGDLGIAVHGQLQPADVVEEINGLYIALYSVAATKAGVQFWINAAHSVDPSITPANASITAISPSVSVYLGQQFVQTQSTYFNSLYGSLDDTQFVKALYQNLTSSSGSNSGVQYWVDLLQSAEASSHDLLNSRAGIAAQFVHDVISIDLTPGASAFGLTGQEYTALVAGQQAMLNKLAVAQYYANQSGTTVGDILNYTSTTGPTFAAAHDVLSDVTNNTSTVIAAIVGINNAVAHQDIGFI